MSENKFTTVMVVDAPPSGCEADTARASIDAADGFLLPELMGDVHSGPVLRAEVAERLLTVWLSDLTRQRLDIPSDVNGTLEQIRQRLQQACLALEQARRGLLQRASLTCASADARS